jgi:putative glutamine amidotransferase
MSRIPVIGITLDFETKDTYSKFPWYALRKNYVEAVAKFGAVPILLPHEPEMVDHYLGLIDGLILTGGDFDIDPKFYGEDTASNRVLTKSTRTEFEMKMLKTAVLAGLPILGICAGEQLLNVFFGGTLYQDILEQVPGAINHEQPEPKNLPYHDIKIKKDSLLHSIVKTERYKVNSTHHQAVKEVGKGLIASAISDDGIIEAIEGTGHSFILGVEWHPEYLSCNEDELIFAAFIDNCARRE